MSNLPYVEPSGEGSWLRVASLMSCKPELATLRRFRKLNVLRLLEMQADLSQQEWEYDIMCSLDAKVDCTTTQSYQRNWTALDESQGLGGSLQRDAWRKLRNGLESYSMCTSPQSNPRKESLMFSKDTALLQQIEICKQDGPSKHDLSFFRRWLIRANGNACSLRGPGSDVWEVSEGRPGDVENDFLVLSAKHSNRDRFERWIGDTLLRVYHRIIGQRFKVGHIFHTACDVLTE